MPAEILIVDDQPANLLALEAVLAPLDRTIVRADTGEAALRELLQRRFAVIVMDVQMPGLDGFQTAALIRGRRASRDVPIIFLTAHDAEFKQAKRAYDLGAFDYITKPFDADILRFKVSAFVRLYEQEERLSEAAEAARLRDVFVGVLGHDLRNPLGAIEMGIALLQRAQDVPERHQITLARISRSADRMRQLIEHVLDFTRGKLGGGIPVTVADMNLSEVCEQIVDEMRTKRPDRTFVLHAPRQVVGRWDAGRLGQMLSNLVANAAQHGDEAPIEVSVEDSGSCVRLVVRNSGFIPAEIVPRLFEPFRRGDDSSGGLGLGLYIVREIVRAHGGAIDVKTDASRRSTSFVVELPRPAVQQAEERVIAGVA